MKKTSILIVTAVVFTFAISASSHAVILLTKEQALKEMFPDVDRVVTETHALTAAEIATIKQRLGGSLVHYQEGSKSEAVTEATSYEFYIGVKNNQKVRMAIIEEQPGKWGPVVYHRHRYFERQSHQSCGHGLQRKTRTTYRSAEFPRSVCQ